MSTLILFRELFAIKNRDHAIFAGIAEVPAQLPRPAGPRERPCFQPVKPAAKAGHIEYGEMAAQFAEQRWIKALQTPPAVKRSLL